MTTSRGRIRFNAKELIIFPCHGSISSFEHRKQQIRELIPGMGDGLFITRVQCLAQRDYRRVRSLLVAAGGVRKVAPRA